MGGESNASRFRRPKEPTSISSSRRSCCRPSCLSLRPIQIALPTVRFRGQTGSRPRTVATILVQRGTLKVGDIFIAGGEWGPARALVDDQGRNVKSAGPSVPVEVLGLSGTPNAGDEMAVMDSEARGPRSDRIPADPAAGSSRLRRWPWHYRADVQPQRRWRASRCAPWSSRPMCRARSKPLSVPLRRWRRMKCGPIFSTPRSGESQNSDVSLASASGGMVVGFNVRANPQARGQAKRDGIDIRYYAIIYNVVDDVRALMTGKFGAETAGDPSWFRRNPRSLQRHQGRQGRRLYDHRRHRPARLQGARVARQHRYSRWRFVHSAPLQGRMSAKSAMVMNAAWPWRITTTSRLAISSNVMKSRKLPASSKAPRQYSDRDIESDG